MPESSPAPRRRRQTPDPVQQGLIASTKTIEEAAAATEVTEESLSEAKAVAASGEVESPSPDDGVDPGVEAPAVHVIHFLEDGMTFLGKVWYRGEEFTVVEGSIQWAALADRNGNRFIMMTEDDQLRKYGKIMFRPGPWPFGGFDYDDPNLSEEDKERLKSVEAAKAGTTSNPRQPGRVARAKSDLPKFVAGFRK